MQQKEPMPQESIADGSDVCFFSADKLLGGPQAGIILGKKQYIDKISQHPLARAYRIDKINLAALHATLLHYIKNEALEKIPIWQMISSTEENLRERAEKFKDHLDNNQYVLLNEIIKNYDKLLFNIEDYPEELHSDCLKKNKELSLLINNCQLNEDTNNKNNKFTIKYLEWNNLFCYSNKSWIDFCDLSNSTFIISGKNGTGKSAIYDILTLSIWNDITKAKQNEIQSGIINFTSNSAYTIVDIETNNITYRIKKIFTRKKDNNHLIKISTEIYQNIDNKFILQKKDNASKQFINDLFGSLDQFLSSSMITQNFDYNILKMNYKDCTELIDKATNIQYIYNLYNLFKNSLNKYKDFIKIITAKKNVYNNLINNYNYDNSNINIIEYKEKLDNLLNEKNKLNNELNKISVNIDKDIIFIDYNNLINKLKYGTDIFVTYNFLS